MAEAMSPSRRAHKHRSYRRRNAWHPIEWPQRVAAARAQGHVRHLGDLLLQLGLPYATARQWARGNPSRVVPYKGHTRTLPATPARPEWMAACEGVPIPPNHELEFLRYLTHPTIEAFQRRAKALLKAGVEEGEALQRAADEVVGKAYREASKRRSVARRRKLGVDPVPKNRLDQETKDRRQARWARNRAKRKGKKRTTRAAQKAIRKAAWARYLIGRKKDDEAALATAVWKVFGVDVKDWPRKSPHARSR